MQRRAERDQGAQQAKRLHRVLVCAAAVPVMLIAAGCSSGSDSGSGGDSAGGGNGSASSGAGADSGASASAAPTVQAAAYNSLPDACGTLSKKTLKSLTPEASKGKKGTSEAGTRGSCSWSSLDNNGVKGSQFRWLNVSLLRFESDTSRGTGEAQAGKYYEQQVQDAQSVAGAKNTKSQAVAGTGDAATLVRYDLKKKEGAFKQQTVVARVENVVVTVDYNGAGLAGDKTPNADDLAKLAEKAAKEAVAAVSAANGEGGANPAPSAPASKAPSKSASPSPTASKSASTSASPSKSAAKTS
ncbi:DUF3558 family protein [Streptomyces griseorubiginosus]|uniref:DUF3558 family protein n=1 Tax=Streptomyces griseorubiginosus TaxID=67304 RepID=UPI000ACDACBB|nr:DUF3558 domain-containing protein [Streptomyces griseorubiginosus]